MKRLEMKNCDMILPVKLQKQKHYHQVKLIETNMLQGRNTTFYQSQMIEHVTFTYSSLRKVLEKQTKKRVDGFESLKVPNKINPTGHILVDSQSI